MSPSVRLVLAAALLLTVAPAGAAAQVVERVVDGDTIIVRDVGRVRLIGVDTPETVHPGRPVEFFGREASAFTKRLVDGKRVRLEYDQQRTDRYGRTLAYVHLPDGTFVNAEIIRRGYGHAYTRFPFKHLERVPRARTRRASRRPRPVGLRGAAGPSRRRTGSRRGGGARPLGRQPERPHLLRGGPAARHRAGAPRPSRVRSHARRRQRRRRVRVSRDHAARRPSRLDMQGVCTVERCRPRKAHSAPRRQQRGQWSPRKRTPGLGAMPRLIEAPAQPAQGAHSAPRREWRGAKGSPQTDAGGSGQRPV